MTNPNIPPEIADSPAKWKSDDRVCTRWDLCPLAGQLHSHSPTPAPVRISPEVRETILRALRMVLSQDTSRARWVECRQDYTELVGRIDTGKDAIAFVEALP